MGYEEPEDPSRHITLRITLGNKHLDSPVTSSVKLIVDYYNKKYPEIPDLEPKDVIKTNGTKADKRLRCKRFGCNKYYDEGSTDEGRHHVKPPVFHETAKYWSCCERKKAYDWESFEAIPGCETSEGHTQEEQK